MQGAEADLAFTDPQYNVRTGGRVSGKRRMRHREFLADRQAVQDFATAKQGTRMATSAVGILTGREADLIIIDDPLKPDEALSVSRRKAVIEWYDHT